MCRTQIALKGVRHVSFDKDSGGKDVCGNYMIDNARLVSEFGVQYRPYRDRVRQIINDIRNDKGLPPID